jgi:hypothetical protein
MGTVETVFAIVVGVRAALVVIGALVLAVVCQWCAIGARWPLTDA